MATLTFASNTNRDNVDLASEYHGNIDLCVWRIRVMLAFKQLHGSNYNFAAWVMAFNTFFSFLHVLGQQSFIGNNVFDTFMELSVCWPPPPPTPLPWCNCNGWLGAKHHACVIFLAFDTSGFTFFIWLICCNNEDKPSPSFFFLQSFIMKQHCWRIWQLIFIIVHTKERERVWVSDWVGGRGRVFFFVGGGGGGGTEN